MGKNRYHMYCLQIYVKYLCTHRPTRQTGNYNNLKTIQTQERMQKLNLEIPKTELEKETNIGY